MKSAEQVQEAREKLREHISAIMLGKVLVTEPQFAILSGALLALAWTMDGESCQTMERLLRGDTFGVNLENLKAN